MRLEFIEDCAKLWWRRWSTWLAGIFAAAAASFVAYPSLLLGLVAFIPEDYRGFLVGAVFAIVLVIPVLTAAIKQPKLTEKIEEIKNAQSSGNSPSTQ